MPDNLRAVLRLVPTGLLTDEGSVRFDELAGVADALDALEAQCGDLEVELHPDLTDVLLARWEAVYGLAAEGQTTEVRKARLLAAVRRVPDFRPVTIRSLAEQWTGLTLPLTEPGPFRCDDPDSVCDNPDDVVDGQHVFILAIDRAAAGDLNRPRLLVFLRTVQPAHTTCLARADEFRCDDVLSLCDLDLLGS